MEGDTLNLTFIYGTTTRHVNKETLDTERSVLPARLKFVLYQLDTLQLSQPQLNPNSTQPNLTKVGLDTKMTLLQKPPPPPGTQHQQYLSCYQRDLDQTLKIVFWDQQQQ